MLRIITKDQANPVRSSMVLATASFGDAFLYPFLPLNAASVGLPVVWIGIILSINRFIRILANGWIVRLCSVHGFKRVTIAACMLAAVSTLGYGISTSVIAWLLFRVMWGLAFSALRISNLAYSLNTEKKGMSIGISKAIHETGPVLALSLGPVLLGHVSYKATFAIMAGLSLGALLFASRLTEIEYRYDKMRKTAISFPSTLNMATFMVAMAIDGMIVMLLGLLLTAYHPGLSVLEITAMAGFYLASRRVCFIVFAPLGGLLSDKLGFNKVFYGSLLLTCIGLAGTAISSPAIPLIIAFVANSINSSSSPGSASHNSADKIRAVAANATWRDIGAATGTFIGGLILTGSEAHTMILIIAALILLLFAYHVINSPNQTA